MRTDDSNVVWLTDAVIEREISRLRNRKSEYPAITRIALRIGSLRIIERTRLVDGQRQMQLRIGNRDIVTISLGGENHVE